MVLYNKSISYAPSELDSLAATDSDPKSMNILVCRASVGYFSYPTVKDFVNNPGSRVQESIDDFKTTAP